jgi:hypothetical protein
LCIFKKIIVSLRFILRGITEVNRVRKLAILNLLGRSLFEEKTYDDYHIKELLKVGVVCNPHSDYSVVYQYVCDKKFNPNATFYKTIEQVAGSIRLELLMDQLVHYHTTYGASRQVKPFIVNDNPIDIEKVIYIDTITEEQAITECQQMLYSGVALSQEAIENILLILDDRFDVNAIKNKEALCIICYKTLVYPNNAEDILRLLVYMATGKTMLIKDKATLAAIAASYVIIENNLTEKLSEVFYRFKDIFISFKNNPVNKHTVNRIRKLAKKHHKPFVPTFWSDVLSKQKELSEIKKRVAELTNFKKISILNAILAERHNNSSVKPFVIRNGSFWIKTETGNVIDKQKTAYHRDLYNILYDSLMESICMNRCEINLPEHLIVMAPTSEKNFMGEIPIYSYVELEDDAIIGINWREADGAQDLDISFFDSNGKKIGWDSRYYNASKTFIYSGDMTRANPQATEILYRKKRSDIVGIVKVAPYCFCKGFTDARYKVFFAIQQMTNVTKNYMVNPKNIIYQYDDMIGGGKSLGVFADNKFIFCNFIERHGRVSQRSVTDLQLHYLQHTHGHLLTLEEILTNAGFTITKSADCKLSKDTILRCFYKNKDAQD